MVCQYFSNFVYCPFIFLAASLQSRFLILMKSSLPTLFLCSTFLLLYPRNLCLIHGNKYFLLCFSLELLQLWYLHLGFGLFWLNFLSGVHYGSKYIFLCMNIQLFYHCFLKFYHFPLNCLCNYITIAYLVLLFYLFEFMPLSHILIVVTL